MQEAIEEAAFGIASGAGGPFGAVVVRGGVVVGRGHNRVIAHNDPTAHAEMEAIRDACRTLGTFHLEGCTLYTSCEPCPMCLAAIYWSRIDAVYYACTRADAAAVGFDDAHFYAELALPDAERSLKLYPVLRKDALPLMRRWYESAEKVAY